MAERVERAPRAGHFRVLLVVLLATVCLLLASQLALSGDAMNGADRAALATSGTVIGAFSDDNYSCSFPGNSAGLVTVHVIVRPDASGVRSVRFSAPPPPCMGATWIADVVPDGIVYIGDSQTGISLSASYCEGVALHVLDILYLANRSEERRVRKQGSPWG